MTCLRSLVFAVALMILTPPYSIVALMTFPLPAFVRYRIISGWSKAVLWLARVVLGIRYSVEGLERLPAQPSIILAKHQSAWETLPFQAIFPPQGRVSK